MEESILKNAECGSKKTVMHNSWKKGKQRKAIEYQKEKIYKPES